MIGYVCGLCSQVVNDLSKDQRSKVKDQGWAGYLALGLSHQETMLSLTVTGGYGLHALPPRINDP